MTLGRELCVGERVDDEATSFTDVVGSALLELRHFGVGELNLGPAAA